MKQDSTPNDDQIPLLLPSDVMAKLDALVARRGCEVWEVLFETLMQAKGKGPAYLNEMNAIAREVAKAFESGTELPWPENSDECLAVGAILSLILKDSAEAYLLETSGTDMEILEAFCRERGISFEKYIQDLISNQLEECNGGSDEEDQDAADWWKG
jgi:hypothetical protein